MDDLRRQLTTIQYPVALRVDGKEIKVGSREDVMIPSAGSLICVYQQGAFGVIDCRQIATLRRETSSRKSAK
jgi:hypothetical protein